MSEDERRVRLTPSVTRGVDHRALMGVRATHPERLWEGHLTPLEVLQASWAPNDNGDSEASESLTLERGGLGPLALTRTYTLSSDSEI